ncbi:glucosylating alpha-toxin TcnA [Clostridium novyi]|uniref:glucosylating alpha-toxin TcnA n=1 Tax=Clostridium novyi TaxID=1542 RepID=UPI00057E3DE1|nr:glucosylating alpha-toxin TcnA [Clostridium novyi]
MLITREQLMKIASIPLKRKEPEYNLILDALENFNRDIEGTSVKEIYSKLSKLNELVDNYQTKYPSSGRNLALENFRDSLYSELRELIKNSRTSTIASKNLSFIWIGGPISDQSLEYYNMWKMFNKDYNIRLFYDKNSLLVNTLKTAIIQESSKVIIEQNQSNILDGTYGHNKFYSDRMKLIYRYKRELKMLYENMKQNNSVDDIIINFLSNYFKYDIGKLNNQKENNNNKMIAIGATDINTENILTNKLKSYYYQELIQTNNLAAASDILRIAILKKYGGVYCDLDFLPGVNLSLFNDISKPNGMDSNYWEAAIFEAIANEKKLMNNYPYKYMEQVPSEIKERILSFVRNHDINDLILPLGDIKISQLEILLSRLKAATGKKTFSNAFIISNNDSLTLNNLISQLENRYEILNSIIQEKFKICETYDSYINSVSELVLETTPKNLSMDGSSFYQQIIGYLSSGFKPEVNSTVFFSGPNIYSSATCDTYHFIKNTFDMLSSQNQEIFEASNNLYFSKTHDEFKSSWLLRSNIAEKEFQKLIKTYIGRTLNYEDGLNFNKWKRVTTSELLKVIEEVNSTKIYENYDLNMILQIQGDDISYESAVNVFGKNPNKSILIQGVDDFANVFYFENGIVQSDNINNILSRFNDIKKIKLTLIGHGENVFNPKLFGGKTVNDLYTNIIKPKLQHLLEREGVILKNKYLKINILGCYMFTPKVDINSTFVGKLFNKISRDLQPKGFSKNQLEISANKYAIRINREGKREVLDYFGKWVSNTDLIAEQISNKYVVYWNEVENALSARVEQLNKVAEFAKDINSIIQTTNNQELKQSLVNTYADLITTLYSELLKEDIPFELDNIQIKERIILNEISRLHDFSNIILDFYQKNNISNNMIILFDSIIKEKDYYNVKLANKITGETSVIKTYSDSLWNFTNKYKKIVDDIKGIIVKDINGEFIKKADFEIEQNPSLLNSAMLMQLLIDYKPYTEILTNMNTSLKVQAYAQIFQLSIGTIQEATEIVTIISDALNANFNILSKLKVGSSVASVIIDGINLIAALTELKNVKTNFERKLIEAKVGMYSIGFILESSSLISGLLGATAVSEILGVISVPVAGILVGLPSLVNNILVLGEKYNQILDYFSKFYPIVGKNPFSIQDNIIIPYDDIAITELNFKYNKFKYGYAKISGFEGGSGHTYWGNIDHYFSAPSLDHYTELSIYPALKLNDTNLPKGNVVLLPSGLNKVYKPEISAIAGANSQEGNGVEVLNLIRNYYVDSNGNTKFPWKYEAPFEYSFSYMRVEYFDTKVNVILDNENKTLIIPVLTIDEMRNKISYEILGDGGQYNVILPVNQTNINIVSNKNDIWNFDVSYIVKESKIEDNKFVLDGFINNIFSTLKVSNDGFKIGKQFISIKNTPRAINLSFKINNNIVIVSIYLNHEKSNSITIISSDLNDIKNNFDNLLDNINYIGLGSISDNTINCIVRNDEVYMEGKIFLNEKKLVFIQNELELHLYDSVNKDSQYLINNPINNVVKYKDGYIVEGTFLINSTENKYSLYIENNKIMLKGLYLESSVFKTIQDKIYSKEKVNDYILSLIKKFFTVNIQLCPFMIVSGVDENNRYLEYMLSTNNKWIINGGYWENDFNNYKIVDFEKCNVIVSGSNKLNSEGDLADTIDVLDKDLENLYIDSVIIIPKVYTKKIIIHPIPNNPQINIINTQSIHDKCHLIIDSVLTNNYHWESDGDDLIITNGLDINIRILQGLSFGFKYKNIYLKFSNYDELSLNDFLLQNYNVKGLYYINGELHYKNIPGDTFEYGWINIDSRWYFFDSINLIAKKGYQEIEGERYYFNPNTGVQESGVFLTPNGLEYFTNKHASSKRWGRAINYTGWLTLDGNKYYFQSNSKAVTGLQKISDKYYYFNDNGQMQIKWQIINNNKYYFDGNTGEAIIGWFNNNKERYYFDSEGRLLTGYQVIGDKSYYFSDNINGNWEEGSGVLKSGIFKTPSGFKLFSSEGDKSAINYKGWLDLNGNKYYFNSDSIAVTGSYNIKGIQYYFNPKTAVLTNGWYTLDNNNYYVSNGHNVLGYQDIDGKGYYFDPSTGIQKAGVFPTPNGLRYFTMKPIDGQKWGQCIDYTGWLHLNGNKYYFGYYNSAVTGWRVLGGKRYFFNIKTGAATTGLLTLSGKRYYFNEKGEQLTGMVSIGGITQYFPVDPGIM